LRTGSTPLLLTGSAGGPVLRWLRELKPEQELLGPGCNTDLIEDEADGLWTWVCAALDLLVTYVPSSVARGPPDGVGE
jgi:hypothetical protein